MYVPTPLVGSSALLRAQPTARVHGSVQSRDKTFLYHSMIFIIEFMQRSFCFAGTRIFLPSRFLLLLVLWYLLAIIVTG